MKARSADYSKKLSRFTQQIESAPQEQASAALFHAGLLLVLAGRCSAAYIAFSYLLEGSLRLSHHSSLLISLERIWLPGLCHSMRLPCPATHHHKKRLPLELAHYIRQNEYAFRAEILLDRWSAPLSTEVNHPTHNENLAQQFDHTSYISQPSQHSCLFESPETLKAQNPIIHSDMFRTLQRAAKRNRLADAIAYIEQYDAALESKTLANQSCNWMTEEIRIIAIDTYFRAGNEQQANAQIIKWWHEGTHNMLSLNRLASFARAFRAIAKGVLSPYVQVSQVAINQFLDAVSNRTFAPSIAKSPTVRDWKALMQQWNRKTFSSGPELDTYYLNAFPEVFIRQDCGQAGATEEQLLKLEKRLGISLPPSYRNFLLYSNGWVILDDDCQLLSTHQVDWFAARNQAWIDAWVNTGMDDEISDEQYFQYGDRQDPVFIRCDYLKTALQISTDGDGYVYLLNPRVVDENGEWEAWDFGNTTPGAYRYRSFWDMMQAIYQRSFDLD